jgi:uncharacterized protein (UPF0261 family)
MGGRAFESLAAEGAFAAVLDFAPQEVGNHLFGSAISAGPERMTAAGRKAIPQVVSIGCHDLVDLVGWHPVPDRFRDSPFHAHNRILSSVVLSAEERRQVARAIAARIGQAKGPVTLLLPAKGAHEWDREGGPLQDSAGLAAFLTELRAACPSNVRLVDLECHINDMGFAEAALAVIDGWIAAGVLPQADVAQGQTLPAE